MRGRGRGERNPEQRRQGGAPAYTQCPLLRVDGGPKPKSARSGIARHFTQRSSGHAPVCRADD
jgi:hypothetical protein